jgi:hypothetical protein
MQNKNGIGFDFINENGALILSERLYGTEKPNDQDVCLVAEYISCQDFIKDFSLTSMEEIDVLNTTAMWQAFDRESAAIHCDIGNTCYEFTKKNGVLQMNTSSKRFFIDLAVICLKSPMDYLNYCIREFHPDRTLVNST